MRKGGYVKCCQDNVGVYSCQILSSVHEKNKQFNPLFRFLKALATFGSCQGRIVYSHSVYPNCALNIKSENIWTQLVIELANEQ